MEDKKPGKYSSTVIDLNSKRIKKRVLEETDPSCKEAVENFLVKFKNDTLTGL